MIGQKEREGERESDGSRNPRESPYEPGHGDIKLQGSIGVI